MVNKTPQSLTDVTVEWMAAALGIGLDSIDVRQIVRATVSWDSWLG